MYKEWNRLSCLMRSRERERAPDQRENPAQPVPAFRRVIYARAPNACDPTAGGRDGMATSCQVHSLYPPAVVHGGPAPGTARSTSADDRPDIRERPRGPARDSSEGEGKERPSLPDHSSAKPHMAQPVMVEHTQRTLGQAGVVGKPSPCPGGDYSPRGPARGKDSEAVTDCSALPSRITPQAAAVPSTGRA